MEKQPRVSIIIPVYNAEKTLERCVDSIINNTYHNFELILIDDNSQDQSLSLCYKYKSEYTIIHHNMNNRGASYSRNKGIELSSGEYIMFVDSDDWIEPDYISLFVNSINNNKDCLVVSGYCNHDESNSGVLGLIKPKKGNYLALYEDTLLQQLWNKIFDANIIKDNTIQFNEELIIGEDFDFVLNYIDAIKENKVIIINSMPYHYMRDQETSLMYNVKPENVKTSLKNLEHLYNIMNMPKDEITSNLKNEKKKLVEVNAYLIMHNKGTSLMNKRKMIMTLSDGNNKLWINNIVLYIKEKISLWIR